MPWNMIEIADHAGHEHGREVRLGDPAAAAADALTDAREHVQEHEHEQERLDQRARDELAEVLAQHDQVAQDQRLQRGAAGGERSSAWVDRDRRRVGGQGCRGRGRHSRSSLPVRLMNTVSSVGSRRAGR